MRQFSFFSRRPEVRTKDFFGKTIQAIIRKYKPKRILEIGAWDGKGSTSCILKKLDYEPISLICVELLGTRANQIKKKITPLYPFVTVYEGSTIKYSDWSFKNFEKDLWNPLPQQVKNRLNLNLIKSCWKLEETNLKKQKQSYFDKHPNEFYDFVIIDGGETTGYDEFRLLKNRFDFIALDDVFFSFKSWLAYQEMLKDDQFILIASSAFVRRGFAVFSKKDKFKR